MTSFELSVRFFLQLAAILVVCRMVSALAKKFGQPPVVGEMIAGVMLGPSLFGLFWPQLQQNFFPPASKPIIFAAAQLGLSLYMFTVGLDFRVDLMRTRLRSAFAISLSGILAPFALGCALAYPLLQHGGFFAPHTTIWTALPYMGASMSITAFPMLARIIYERKLSNTTVGALALAAGAIDDAAAWGVLAIVLALMSGKISIALTAIVGGGAFVFILFWIGQPLLKRLMLQATDESQDRIVLGWITVILMLVSWFTDTIGLYAVFGAFFLGVAMPRGKATRRLQEKIEPLTTSVLVPLFFIYSGLNTRIDLLNDGSLWMICGAALAAGVLGKMGACYLAARWCGESHRESLGVGALMNARGLMELIILNIGLERGLITPALFTIMVLMAVITTLMATPLFNLVFRNFQPATGISVEELERVGS